jgi:hypothetical protein
MHKCTHLSPNGPYAKPGVDIRTFDIGETCFPPRRILFANARPPMSFPGVPELSPMIARWESTPSPEVRRTLEN